MSTSESRKRKREPDTMDVSSPLVKYRGSSSLGTFIRSLNQYTLWELHNLLRTELQLENAEPIRLRWKHKIDYIRLENEGDFLSFSQLVQQSRTMIEVEIIEPRNRRQLAPFPMAAPQAQEKPAAIPEKESETSRPLKIEDEDQDIIEIDLSPSLAFGPKRYQEAVKQKRSKSNPALPHSQVKISDAIAQEPPAESQPYAPASGTASSMSAKDKGQKKQTEEFVAMNARMGSTLTPSASIQNLSASQRTPAPSKQVATTGVKEPIRKKSTGDLDLTKLIPPKTPTAANIVSRTPGSKNAHRPHDRSSSAHSASSARAQRTAAPPASDSKDEHGSASEPDEEIPKIFREGKALEAQHYVHQCKTCKAESRGCVLADARASRAVPACWPCRVTRRGCSFVSDNERVNVKWRKYDVSEELWMRAKQNNGQWPLVRKIGPKSQAT